MSGSMPPGLFNNMHDFQFSVLVVSVYSLLLRFMLVFSSSAPMV